MFKRVAIIALSAFALSALSPAFAGEKIKAPEIADDARNPPPAVALKTFQRFELSPVAMGAPWPGRRPTRRPGATCRRTSTNASNRSSPNGMPGPRAMPRGR